MSRIRFSHLTAVAAGGAIGATLRVVIGALVPALPGAFPLATWAENAAGALLLGALLVLFRDRLRDGGGLYLFACTGVLGSFTTFSTLSVELVALSNHGHPGVAILYALASVAAGLAAALAGMRGAAWLTGRRKGRS